MKMKKKMHFFPWDRKKKMLKMHLSACHKKKKKKDTLISTPASWLSRRRRSARCRWSILPKNVLFNILDRLTDIDDYFRFGAVCVCWRSVFAEDRNSFDRMLKMHLTACNSKKKKKDTRISTTASWLSPCSAQRDWWMLPKNVLFDILDRLTDIDDYVRFGAVCPSWRSVLTEDKHSHNKKRHCSQPFLLIGYPSADDHRMVMYSLSRDETYNFDLHLPDDNYFCRGSSFGWLVTLHVQDMDNYFRMVNQSPYARYKLPDTNKYSVQLQNPFLPLNRIIHLPGLDSMIQQHPFYENELPDEELYLWKAVLSSDPMSSDKFYVVAIMSGFCGLAFFKSGSKDWTSIGQWRKDWEESRCFKDVMFSEKTQRFYALRSDYEVLIIDFLEGGEPNLRQLMPPIDLKLGMCDPSRMYLVEDISTGELLQVHKDYRKGSVVAFFFVLFKLDLLKRSWVRMQNLADKVMFLGNNNSIVRSASDCPGCEPNCVYYTDDMRCYPFERGYGPPYDGIYNFEDDAVQPHCLIPPCGKRLPPSVWVEHTLL